MQLFASVKESAGEKK